MELIELVFLCPGALGPDTFKVSQSISVINIHLPNDYNVASLEHVHFFKVRGLLHQLAEFFLYFFLLK